MKTEIVLGETPLAKKLIYEIQRQEIKNKMHQSKCSKVKKKEQFILIDMITEDILLQNKSFDEANQLDVSLIWS